MINAKSRILALALAASLTSIIFIHCGKKPSSDEVVVYTSVDQVFSEPVLKEFEKETGIRVKAVFDAEETKSTGVLNRLIAEKDNPHCDVFWSGDPVRNIILKNRGIAGAYIPKTASDIDAKFRDTKGYWTGFSARARVLLYNKNLIKPSEAPNSILDLIKPEWKGKCSIANPLFGTTSFHLAALFSELGDVKAKEFMNNMKRNDVVIGASNGDVKKKVTDGEVAFGLLDTDDANEAKKDGSPVESVFMDQSGLGTLVIPNALTLIRNSPNQTNAKKLIDYLLRPEVEKKLAALCTQMPLLKSTGRIPGITNVNDIKSMKVDYEEAGKKLDELQEYLRNWLK